MDISLYITFITISAGLILLPGPNILVIIATSLAHGRVRGFQTVAGTTTAMSIQLAVAAIGTNWFIMSIADGFYILKWLGVIYLLYLSYQYFRKSLSTLVESTTSTASSSFNTGFIVSLTNPKTILFFATFLPQFISSTENYTQQIVILSATFLFMAALFDSGYVLISAKFRHYTLIAKLTMLTNRISAFILLATSIWLAMLRRT